MAHHLRTNRHRPQQNVFHFCSLLHKDVKRPKIQFMLTHNITHSKQETLADMWARADASKTLSRHWMSTRWSLPHWHYQSDSELTCSQHSLVFLLFGYFMCLFLFWLHASLCCYRLCTNQIFIQHSVLSSFFFGGLFYPHADYLDYVVVNSLIFSFILWQPARVAFPSFVPHTVFSKSLLSNFWLLSTDDLPHGWTLFIPTSFVSFCTPGLSIDSANESWIS